MFGSLAPSYGQSWNYRRITLKATVMLTTKYNLVNTHYFLLIWQSYFTKIKKEVRLYLWQKVLICAAHKGILDNNIMSSLRKVSNVWPSYQSCEHLGLTNACAHIIPTTEDSLYCWSCWTYTFSWHYCKSDEAALINSRSSGSWMDGCT